MIFTSKNGTKWYLSRKETIIGRNHLKTVTHFFRKEKKEDYCEELPVTLMVKETRTGLPVVKHL